MKLKQLLADNNITQTQLARLLGRDKSVVTNLLQGRRHLKADEAAIIARELGVPVAEILGLEEIVNSTGVGEACLIPFQHAPRNPARSRQVVNKGGKYFLEEGVGFSPKAYALEVHDDALNLAGILPGDIVVSELDRPVKKGQVAVAQLYGAQGATTVLRRYEPPFLIAHSTNAEHRTLSLEHDDVRVVSPVIKLVRLL